MKYFGKLTAKVNGHDLMIDEVPCLLGFHLSKQGSDNEYHHIDSRDTLEACKELALEMYGAPLDGWRSSSREYLQSLMAISSGNKPGYTFRIIETKIDDGHLCGEGAYLYGFDGKSKYQEYDYGQNTIQDCKEFALEEFKIPLNAWREE